VNSSPSSARQAAEKSTLLNAVAGFLKPTRGRGSPSTTIRWRDQAPTVAWCFNNTRCSLGRRCARNVEFGLKMKGMERSKRETSARTLLGLAGLLAFENQYPDNLSGGMKQARRKSSARFATGPKVLLLDEPFGRARRADPASSCSRSSPICGSGLKTSVLFVTHDIDEAIFLSDRVYCMTARPGTIKGRGSRSRWSGHGNQSMMMSVGIPCVAFAA